MVISDNEIMFKVKDGHINDIAQLYERYSKVLFAYFFKLTGMQATSEDLVNDTFFKIIKNREKFKGTGKFKIWMFKIARSVFVDHYKKNKPFVLTDNYREQKKEINQYDDTSAAYEATENDQLLHNALLKLKRNEREILILSNFDGLKYKEIAEILKCSEGAVKVRVFRALQNLRVIYLNHKD